MSYTMSDNDINNFFHEIKSIKNIRNLLKSSVSSNVTKKFDEIIETQNLVDMNDIKNTKRPLSEEDFKNLHNSLCSIHALISHIQPIINSAYVESIEQSYLKLYALLQPYLKEKEDESDNQIEYFGKIQEENGFTSVWSIWEVKDINAQSTMNINTISYESWGKPIKETVNLVNPTYLDIWKMADKIILQSKDSHHIYIERISEDVKGSGNFTLITGS